MRDLAFVTEHWLPCVGYEDLYEVSDLGRVRGKTILVQRLNQRGYPSVRFWINGKGLERNPHRLVAEAFVPNPENKRYVNHINGIKTDNNVWNLEWTTNSENQLHAYRLGLQPSKKGENNSNTKLTDIDVTVIKIMYNSGQKLPEISKKLNIKLSILREIIYGRTWRSNTTPVLKRDDRSKTKKPIYHEYK